MLKFAQFPYGETGQHWRNTCTNIKPMNVSGNSFRSIEWSQNLAFARIARKHNTGARLLVLANDKSVTDMMSTEQKG